MVNPLISSLYLWFEDADKRGGIQILLLLASV